MCESVSRSHILQTKFEKDETADIFRRCKQCRSMKVKCSGSHPCARCARNNKDCQFAKDEARVSVTERYLRQLEEELARVRAGNSQPETVEEPMIHNENVDISSYTAASPISSLEQTGAQRQTQAEGSDPSLHFQTIPQQHRAGNSQEPQQNSESVEFSWNPLVDKDNSFAQTPDGRFWYMGPTSSWSFCRRVLALIGRRVPPSSCPADPLNLDGMAFELRWTAFPFDRVPDVSGLPPLDYSLFLYNTVKFYFGSLSCIIDEPTYLQKLHEFYEDPASKAASSRAWYSQYLLTIAFGKAFLSHQNLTDSPPGHQYASRAMSVLPGLSGLEPNPLAGIEALSLAAIYFQAIDMRMAAYNHIGQALRTCVIEGIHRHVLDDLAGPSFARRCRNIFWVVYMLDHEFSALIGAPNSIRDEDITVKLPTEVGKSSEDIYLSLHVQLAQLMAQISATVYAVDKGSQATLIPNTQSVIRKLAQLSQDMNSLETHFEGPISQSSRMAVQLMLSYHHCVVLTTRPLVMCALQMHVAGTEERRQQNISLSAPVSSLLQCCANSAQTILQILRNLASDDLTESFLPFQVEDTSSSAFVLYLIRTIAPSLIQNDVWHDNLDFILKYYISRGNHVVSLRNRELQQLEHLLTPPTPSPGEASIEQELERNSGNWHSTFTSDNLRLEGDLEWHDLELYSCLTIPPNELQYLASQLNVDDLLHPPES